MRNDDVTLPLVVPTLYKYIDCCYLFVIYFIFALNFLFKILYNF